MRLDKYLKVSRLVKEGQWRTFRDAQHVSVNGKVASLLRC